MLCINCKNISFKIICKTCIDCLDINLSSREISNLKIYSFFDYSDVKNIISTKHTMSGYFAFNAIAKLSFVKFAKEFKINEILNVVPVDDKIKSGYSHSAILAKSLKSKFLKPIYRVLYSDNNVSYSGKDLKFRQNNPRNFKLLKKPRYPVILVDDIITSGNTLLEASKILNQNNIEVYFAIVLADARF